MKKKVTSIHISHVHNGEATIIDFMRKGEMRSYGTKKPTTLSSVGRVLNMVNNLKLTPHVAMGTHGISIHYTVVREPKKTQTNVHFSEGHYREAMRYVFHFFDNNVDGFLEGSEQADFCWHLLGGMVCDSPYWTKQQHVEALLELKRDSWGGSAIWKAFFDNPLEY